MEYFQETDGERLVDYGHNVRTVVAQELVNIRSKLINIAHKYCYEKIFTKAFWRTYGINPSKLRNRTSPVEKRTAKRLECKIFETLKTYKIS